MTKRKPFGITSSVYEIVEQNHLYLDTETLRIPLLGWLVLVIVSAYLIVARFDRWDGNEQEHILWVLLCHHCIHRLEYVGQWDAREIPGLNLIWPTAHGNWNQDWNSESLLRSQSVG